MTVANYPEVNRQLYLLNATHQEKPAKICFNQEERIQAIRELSTCRGTALKVVQNVGVSVPVLSKWKKDLIDDETYQSMRKIKSAPPDKQLDALLDEVKQLSSYGHRRLHAMLR